MSFFAKHTSKIILLLAAILLTSGCNLNFNPMRYPDLRKIPVNAQRADDSNHMLQAQKMHMLRALKFVEKAEELAWMNPLSVVVKSNATSHTPFLIKVSEKKKVLKSKLSITSHLRKMIEKQTKPVGNQVLITLLLAALLIGLIFLAIKVTKLSKGFGCVFVFVGIFLVVIAVLAIIWKDHVIS